VVCKFIKVKFACKIRLLGAKLTTYLIKIISEMTINSINPKTLQSWLKKQEAILLDVREIAENKVAKIKNSILIPLTNVDVDKLPNLNGKKLVVHCKSGKRSLAACEKLLAQNPDLEIYNLEGGIDAWKNDGLEISSGNKSFIPLERQVQITVGGAVFLGTLLGIFVAKIFLIIPLFFSAGLVFAGCSGWCGLAMLLAKLPFNQKADQTNFCQTKY
jgi:rhodanese-related sulfurtransferase